MSSPLILVHIGDNFPEYINTCIAQLHCVSNVPIHVLISRKHADKIKGGIVYSLESIKSTDKFTQFESVSRLDEKFRGGFWKYAMFRFFYIYNHMVEHSLTNVFHIEYDNLIYLDFTKYLSIFQTKPMWCVMDSPNRCIPSFLYWRDTEFLSKLLDTCIESSSKGENDMIALAKFRNNNPDVGTLPIVKGYKEEVDEMYWRSADAFNCLFDGAAIGQYIGGVDPRNNSGDTRGFINETTVIKCNKMKVEWRNKKPYLNDMPLVNLHIHSKDLLRWAEVDSNYFNIISGELIQEKCDIYLGIPEDFQYNPRISTQTHKCLSIETITRTWDNPYIIFCYSHRISAFRKILPHIKNNFILVTHNSDENVRDEYMDIANNDKLVEWYAQNTMVDHPKINLLPIGIANSMWPHGDIDTIKNIRRNIPKKCNDFYFFFNVGTNRNERNPCKDVLEKKGIKFGGSAANYKEYIKTLSTYKYAICPPGNGVDSHRIWECVYLNVIPILKRSIFTEKLQNLFYCIVLDKWEDFNQENLLAEYKEPRYDTCSIFYTKRIDNLRSF